MGWVSDNYELVTDFLDDVAASQFGAVASAFGTTGQLAASVVAVLTVINMGMQVRPTPTRDSIILIVRLSLIALFFKNWSQFDVIASAIFDVLERTGGALIASVASEGSVDNGFGSFNGMAGAMDNLLTSISEYANNATEHMGYMGGIMFGAVFAVLQGLMGAAALLVMSAARVIITVMIGLAPLAILTLLFEFTKNWFERWLSAIVTFALYPVVIAGIFATIVGVVQQSLKNMGDPENATTIGQVIPLFMVVFLALSLILAIPLIVSAIAGNFHLASGVQRMLGMSATAAQSGAGFSKRAAGAAGRGGAHVVSETVGAAKSFAQDPAQASRQAMQGHADRIAQLSARAARLGRGM